MSTKYVGKHRRPAQPRRVPAPSSIEIWGAYAVTFVTVALILIALTVWSL